MFRTNKFLMIKDVTNILNLLLQDFESDDSLESFIYAVRDLNVTVKPAPYRKQDASLVRELFC